MFWIDLPSRVIARVPVRAGAMMFARGRTGEDPPVPAPEGRREESLYVTPAPTFPGRILMEHIRQAFNKFAQDYDAQREFVIPQMREYYGAAVWAMETREKTPAILDVGAGTGLMSAFLLEKFPDARLTLMDISENMLDQARKRFASRPKTEYVVCDYSRSELGGPYDIVCSALSIHHLAPEDKRQLFCRIFAALKPGGIFVNADQALGETPYFTQRNLDYWNDFLRSGPMTEAQHAEILKRRDTLDRNEKLSDQLAWLQKAGFADVDVVYRNRTFIVTVARKDH
jgi:tRNA (cmo5U34)-methyltransferase